MILKQNEDMQSKEDKNTKFNSANVGEGLNPMRKRIAQNMRQSLGETAQLTYIVKWMLTVC